MRPSACQRLFEEDQRGRAPIRKCTVASCPLSTASRFRKAFTQPHWAHRRRSPSAVRRPPLLTPHAAEHRRTSPLSSSRRAMRVRPVATTPQDMPTQKNTTRPGARRVVLARHVAPVLARAHAVPPLARPAPRGRPRAHAAGEAPAVRCGQLCSAASRCAQSTLQQVLQPYTPHAPR